MGYRSKDPEYMTSLEAAVRAGLTNRSPAQQDYIAEFTQKKVILDDLRRYAISVYGEPIYVPPSGYNAELMVVSYQPLTESERDILDKMLEAVNIPNRVVYTTFLNKTDTENFELPFAAILNTELNVVNPKKLLVIDDVLKMGVSTPFKIRETNAITTLPLSNVTPETRGAIWSDFKQLVQS